MTSSSDDTFRTRALTGAIAPEARRVKAYRLRVSSTSSRSSELKVDAPVFRIGTQKGNDLVVDDTTVSRMHLEISADSFGHRMRDLGSTNGTFVDDVRAADTYLRNGATIRLGRTRLEFEELDEVAEVPRSSVSAFGPVVGESLPMRELFAVLERAAPTDATVLIEGETGTGKELVAQAVHHGSHRALGPFVVFDCASVPANLLESELFGHEKGAFTGADGRRIGLMEEASGGTLFLDELGELPLDLQPRLLRALETREVRRVGGTKTLSVDVRIVAATNRDLAREVNRGAFREDLYYRLAVVRVTLPPLRDRPEDIPLLVGSFVRHALPTDPERAEKIVKGIRPENWKRLMAHPWPGNVRELRNVIDRTLALSSAGSAPALDPPTVRPRSSPPLRSAVSSIDFERPFVDLKAEVLAQFEERYLIGQLERHNGNISRAAAAAGMDRMYFKRLLKKYKD